MKTIWHYVTRVFQQSSGVVTVDSCRVMEAMMPMAELYGVDIHDLPALRLHNEPR